MIYKKIVVTGASGYLGSCLVKFLVQHGVEVACVIRPASDLSLLGSFKEKITLIEYNSNVLDLIVAFQEFQAGAVVHLASHFLATHKPEDITSLINSNILFGSHLLEAMLQSGIKKLINTTTFWQYFQSDDYNPVCLYAATKEAFEKIITYYVAAHNFSCISLQLYDTYGPNDPRKKLFWLLKTAVEKGENLKMSPGEQRLNLVHIDDVISAYFQSIKLLSESNEGVQYKFTIDSSDVYSLKNIVNMYEEKNNVKLNINWGARAYRDREVMVPVSNIPRLPGWFPVISLENGIIGI